MPILQVEVVLTQKTEKLPRKLASTLAEAASAVFGSPAGNTWVRLRTLLPENYAENGAESGEGVGPVLVSVLKAHLPAWEELQREAVELTEAISQAIGRPAGNIHLIYEAPGAGRVAFGGKLVFG